MKAIIAGSLAIKDGESSGTKNMIDQAERRGLRLYVHRIDANP